MLPALCRARGGRGLADLLEGRVKLVLVKGCLELDRLRHKGLAAASVRRAISPAGHPKSIC